MFTAGIGEHAPEIRKRIYARLGWLPIRLDQTANERNAVVISTAASGVSIRVIPTDEEAMIVEHTLQNVEGTPMN